jgi:PAS domain S-box-containing protein
MEKRIVQTDAAPAAVGPYSQAVRAGDLLFTAGQIPLLPDGTLLDANEAALSFGDLTRDDVVGKPFWEAHWWQISEQTQSQLKDAIDRAIDGEFVRYDVEVQGADRTAVIDFSLRPVTNEAGEVMLLVPEGRDITELKEHEHQLQRLDQLNTVIRTIVRTVARAETHDGIAQTVCDTLLEFEAYQATVMGEFS